MEKEKPVNMAIGKELLDQVDEWRFKNRVPSRVEAIRWLLSYALKQRPKKED